MSEHDEVAAFKQWAEQSGAISPMSAWQSRANLAAERERKLIKALQIIRDTHNEGEYAHRLADEALKKHGVKE